MSLRIRTKLGTLNTSKTSDNTWLAAKFALREWALRELPIPTVRVYEVFGSGGASTEFFRAHTSASVDACNGDALAELRGLPRWDYDWFDVDPWGDPWAALAVIASQATQPHIAVFVCDGAMTMAGKLRFAWPTTVRETTGWTDADATRKRWVWYNYPDAFAHVLAAVVGPRWSVVRTRSAPRDSGRKGTVVRYSAAILARAA